MGLQPTDPGTIKESSTTYLEKETWKKLRWISKRFLRSIRKPESCEDMIDVSFSLQNQWIIRTSFVDKRNSATLVRMPKY